MTNKEDYLEPCAYCGNTVNVSYVSDPYDLEMTGVEHKMYLCESCYEGRLDDLDEEGEEY